MSHPTTTLPWTPYLTKLKNPAQQSQEFASVYQAHERVLMERGCDGPAPVNRLSPKELVSDHRRLYAQDQCV